MKTRKYLFVLAVVAVVNSNIVAQGSSLLLKHINPALIAIEKVYVVIKPDDTDSDEDGLVWNQLRKEIENKLISAGIEIAPEPEKKNQKRDRNIPELRVSMEMLKFTQSKIYVFSLQLSFATKVYLKEQNVSFKAEAWKAVPTIQAVPIHNMPAKVTVAVIEQTQDFIQAYKLANLNTTPSADPNDNPKNLKNQNNAVATTEYRYIASKNSKVFHKTTCSWAENIAPKNRVGYSTLEQVEQDGKRPCKACKP